MEEAEFQKIIKNEQYAHLFLDLAMKKLAYELAEQKKLKQTSIFKIEYIKSHERLGEELKKLKLTDEAHFHLQTYGPDAYVMSTFSLPF
jgi:hypothetical protein